MTASRFCSDCSTGFWGSMQPRRDRRRVDAEAPEQPPRSCVARLQPDLVEPENVALSVDVRRVADLTQGVHQRLELGRQFREHARGSGLRLRSWDLARALYARPPIAMW